MSPCLFDNYVLKALRLWGEQRVHELRQEDKEWGKPSNEQSMFPQVSENDQKDPEPKFMSFSH